MSKYSASSSPSEAEGATRPIPDLQINIQLKEDEPYMYEHVLWQLIPERGPVRGSDIRLSIHAPSRQELYKKQNGLIIWHITSPVSDYGRLVDDPYLDTDKLHGLFYDQLQKQLRESIANFTDISLSGGSRNMESKIIFSYPHKKGWFWRIKTPTALEIDGFELQANNVLNTILKTVYNVLENVKPQTQQQRQEKKMPAVPAEAIASAPSQQQPSSDAITTKKNFVNAIQKQTDLPIIQTELNTILNELIKLGLPPKQSEQAKTALINFATKVAELSAQKS